MKRILAALLLLTLAAPACSYLRFAITAAIREFAAALREFRPLADQGDAESQYMLSKIYGNGRGVRKDLTEVVRWYRKALDQGHVKAQFELGYYYYEIENLPKEKSAAGVYSGRTRGHCARTRAYRARFTSYSATRF